MTRVTGMIGIHGITRMAGMTCMTRIKRMTSITVMTRTPGTMLTGVTGDVCDEKDTSKNLSD